MRIRNGGGRRRAGEAALLDALPDMVLVLDEEGRVVYANETVRRAMGLGDESLGRSAFDFVHPDDLAVVLTSMGTISGKRVGSPIEFRIRTGGDRWQWVELVGSDCRSVDGVRGYLCVARDITERKRWEIAGSDVARFQHVFQHGASLTFLLDPDGTIAGANNALNRVLGHDKSLVLGRPLWELAAPDGVFALHRAVEMVRETSDAVSVEVPMRHVDESLGTSLIRFEIRSLSTDPALAGIVATGQDITELQLARRELQHLVDHDPLTGVANRTLLVATIEQLLAEATPFALLFVDLDGFKAVNDRFGHRFGDDVLRVVASRLASCTRPGDLVARTGGDEFVVVARGFEHREAASRFGQRLEEAVAEPLFGSDLEVEVRASIGVAIATPSSTFDSLIDAADARMYERKTARARSSDD